MACACSILYKHCPVSPYTIRRYTHTRLITLLLLQHTSGSLLRAVSSVIITWRVHGIAPRNNRHYKQCERVSSIGGGKR